tara:strand:- start:1833 stop:2939 length:1107 start_codon:yes stop_codon:yes gene_type:complete
MKIYLVGGAIRDKLLGLEPKERDWVVVGSSPDEMKSNGFKQVGKDFPVFLHPKTGEEYALARTERKSGHGYRGFEFDINSNVTLEEDLERRDLTINAIAEDESGVLIDPFNGQRDIRDKKLRHVSHAFSEDPLRVLRILRFKTNLPDFEIVPETKDKINEIISSGELEYLTGERIWLEMHKTKNLSNFLLSIIKYNLTFLFPGLSKINISDLDCDYSTFDELNKLHSTSYIISKFEDNIDLLCNKIKAPNEYRELAIMIYQNMSNVLNYEVSNFDDYGTLLSLIKKLDIRKKERITNFFKIAENQAQIQSKSSVNIEFFKSLILKIDKYRLDPEHKAKNNLEIKEIIDSKHKEIVQDHIREYLNNKQS